MVEKIKACKKWLKVQNLSNSTSRKNIIDDFDDSASSMLPDSLQNSVCHSRRESVNKINPTKECKFISNQYE